MRLLLSVLAAIVPLHVGGPRAHGPVAGAGGLGWSEDGSAYVSRGGKTRRVAQGEVIGVGAGVAAVLRSGVLRVGSRRPRWIGATDGRWSDGHLLAVSPDLDGRVSVRVDGRLVEHVRADNPHVYPGQINTRFAVWTAGGAGHYWVERYDLHTHRLLRIPGGDYAHPQYGASVDERGTVYFAQSGFGCGGATIYRWAGGRRTRIVKLDREVDYGSSWYRTGGLLLDLVRCAGSTQRLVELRL